MYIGLVSATTDLTFKNGHESNRGINIINWLYNTVELIFVFDVEMDMSRIEIKV